MKFQSNLTNVGNFLIFWKNQHMLWKTQPDNILKNKSLDENHGQFQFHFRFRIWITHYHWYWQFHKMLKDSNCDRITIEKSCIIGNSFSIDKSFNINKSFIHYHCHKTLWSMLVNDQLNMESKVRDVYHLGGM